MKPLYYGNYSTRRKRDNNKSIIEERTLQRRRYNAIVDGAIIPSEMAVKEFNRDPMVYERRYSQIVKEKSR